MTYLTVQPIKKFPQMNTKDKTPNGLDYYTAQEQRNHGTEKLCSFNQPMTAIVERTRNLFLPWVGMWDSQEG